MSHIKILIPTEAIIVELHSRAECSRSMTYKNLSADRQAIEHTHETSINKFQAFFHNKEMFKIF